MEGKGRSERESSACGVLLILPPVKPCSTHTAMRFAPVYIIVQAQIHLLMHMAVYYTYGEGE